VVRDMKPEVDDDPEDDGVVVATPLLDPLPDPDPEALALPDMADCVALPLALVVDVSHALADVVLLDDDEDDVVTVAEPLLDPLLDPEPEKDPRADNVADSEADEVADSEAEDVADSEAHTVSVVALQGT